MRKALARPIRFGLVGIANTAVDFGVFLAMMRFGAALVPAVATGFACGVVNSYMLNRCWTFHDVRQQQWRLQFLIFIASSLLGLALTVVIVKGLAPMAGVVSAKLVAIAVGFAFNYGCSRMLVFRST